MAPSPESSDAFVISGNNPVNLTAAHKDLRPLRRLIQNGAPGAVLKMPSRGLTGTEEVSSQRSGFKCKTT